MMHELLHKALLQHTIIVMEQHSTIDFFTSVL